MTETFVTVGWDSNTNEWNICVGERIHSGHSTKQEAIDEGKSIDTVNTVMVFTKGGSGMETHHC